MRFSNEATAPRAQAANSVAGVAWSVHKTNVREGRRGWAPPRLVPPPTDNGGANHAPFIDLGGGGRFDPKALASVVDAADGRCIRIFVAGAVTHVGKTTVCRVRVFTLALILGSAHLGRHTHMRAHLTIRFGSRRQLGLRDAQVGVPETPNIGRERAP